MVSLINNYQNLECSLLGKTEESSGNFLASHNTDTTETRKTDIGVGVGLIYWMPCPQPGPALHDID